LSPLTWIGGDPKFDSVRFLPIIEEADAA
jgi:hypothetical protein